MVYLERKKIFKISDRIHIRNRKLKYLLENKVRSNVSTVLIVDLLYPNRLIVVGLIYQNLKILALDRVLAVIVYTIYLSKNDIITFE